MDEKLLELAERVASVESQLKTERVWFLIMSGALVVALGYTNAFSIPREAAQEAREVTRETVAATAPDLVKGSIREWLYENAAPMSQEEIASMNSQLNEARRRASLLTSELQSVLAAQRGKWESATLEPGWSRFDGAHAEPSYLKDGFGVVHLRGLVVGPPGKAPVFVLPEGFRPAVRHVIPVACAGEGVCQVAIDKDGGVWFAKAPPPPAWTSFDGVSFRVAEVVGG